MILIGEEIIESIFIEWLQKNPKKRRNILIILCILSILSIIGGITVHYQKYDESIEITCVILFIISGYTSLMILRSYKNSNQIEELINVRSERNEIIQRISQETKKNGITDIILLNLNRLSEYYTINLTQAKNSYRYSIIGVCIGTLIFIYCIWSFIGNDNPNITVTIIGSIMGIITDFIAASYFYLYKKSIVQLNMYFKELIKIQDTMLAIELCNKINAQSKEYNESINSIIMELLKRSSQNTKE